MFVSNLKSPSTLESMNYADSLEMNTFLLKLGLAFLPPS